MADGLRFTDLTQLASNNVNGQDITAISHYNAGSYSSMSLQIQDLGRALLGNLSYTTELPNFGSQTVFGALLQLLANFANVYNPASTYALNTCVIYQGVLYKCTTAIVTPEAWDSTHWTAIKAVDVGSGGGGGGASALNDLTDVTIISAELTDGQVIKYDDSSHQFINALLTLGNLDGVNISTLALSNGQFIVYDSVSGEWKNKEVIHEPITQAQYDAMVQAGTVDPNVYYPITDASIEASEIDYDNTNSGLTATDVQDAIDEVNDNIADVADDIPSNSDFSLSGLSDTTITSPSSGQVLSYDGGKWKNKGAEDFKNDITYNEGTASGTGAYKVANMVFITYQGQSQTHSAGDTLFVIPTGYRPIQNFEAAFTVDGKAYGQVHILANGNVNINNISDNTVTGRIYFSVAYPIA